MDNTITDRSQWNWRWILGLTLAGTIIFAAQRAMTFESRIQVLENEKTYIVERLNRIEGKIDRLDDKMDRANRSSKRDKLFDDDPNGN
jgi:hypothetical protein